MWCDGMGGAQRRQYCAVLPMTPSAKAITENYTPDMEEDAVRDIMLHAINDANAAVLHRAQEDPALNGMGTTVVVSIAAGGVLHIAHAGDSRCYLKTALGVKQVTTDHSFVQQLVESGAITEDEARVHPQRNLITRVLGVHPEVECDYGCYKFEPGDLALSCTDGLSNYLESDTLLLFISNYQEKNFADELIRYANSKGGSSDNVTVAGDREPLRKDEKNG